MKTLFIEAKMGIAGDMLMAALYEICPKKDEYLQTMNSIFPDFVSIKPKQGSKCGISGTHMEILINGQEELEAMTDLSAAATLDHHTHHESNDHHTDHEHHTDHQHHTHHEHHSYEDLIHRISDLNLPSSVKEDSIAIYKELGLAEAKVHNTSIEQIHFHEVSSLDALIDVVGCCLLFHLINPDQIIASPIHVGNGTVHCAHGILPVPAPATAELLRGIPYYTGNINSELCTPTGAALVKYFVQAYKDMPVMTISGIGYGLGTKDFDVANVLRVFEGECASDLEEDKICDISCNLDDMTGEALGYAMDLLMEQGALDVYFSSIQMKKNRPGVLLHCFCPKDEAEKFISLILKHTTTRGVRYQYFNRRKLTSSIETASTSLGDIRIKKSQGPGIVKQKAEFEDVKRLAKENNLSLAQIYQEL